jgi:hypothetical protein
MTHKNKITTGGYFINRLKDSGFIAIRIYNHYAILDPRRWTIMVDPGESSLLITCYENKEFCGDIVFEFNDGGNKFPKNYNLKTKSMEVIMTTLIERGIQQKTKDSVFIKAT